MNVKHFATALAFAAFLPIAAHADERPPADSKTISEVIEALEKQGFDPITEVQYDDKQWQAEGYKDGERHEIKLDPMTLEVIQQKLDS